MRNSNVVASLVMLAIVAVFWPQMRDFTFFGIVFPKAVLAALGVISGLLLIVTLLRKEGGKRDIEVPGLRTVALVILLMVMWIALMPVLGFFVSSLLAFGLLMLLIDPSARNLKALARSMVAVAIELGIFYLAFSTLLEVPLPRGILF